MVETWKTLCMSYKVSRVLRRKVFTMPDQQIPGVVDKKLSKLMQKMSKGLGAFLLLFRVCYCFCSAGC